MHQVFHGGPRWGMSPPLCAAPAGGQGKPDSRIAQNLPFDKK
ncbi:hypothetical protein MBELCI_0596 [Limimaricola cinnabarinus LL-001]|uniref:Uncharacterized protein n=1 Tax=Limimaricola cinnabarinus LL-001 TaxID=1337093 RepID=U3AA44_9RHOB|nr:hypothetical protein MBELCI_0596 [Limimaricola cinnabarinus LL-001]